MLRPIDRLGLYSPQAVEIALPETTLEQAAALAGAIRAALRQKRRTQPSTQAIVEEQFRAEAVARQYFAIYAEVTA